MVPVLPGDNPLNSASLMQPPIRVDVKQRGAENALSDDHAYKLESVGSVVPGIRVI